MSPMHINKQDQLVVFLGGHSQERDVSLRTGQAIAQALSRKGYTQVLQVDPKDNMDDFSPATCKAAFIALHGKGGEDGEIQRFLTQAGVPYTGTQVHGSRLSMSKAQSKKAFVEAQVPTLPWVVSHSHQTPASFEAACLEKLTLPIIGKPDTEGSSIGMQIVHDRKDLKDAFTAAHSFDGEVVWEPFLTGGIDLTVAILQGRALPVVEIRPKSGLYDFEAKYTSGKTDYHCPARIDPEIAQAISDQAVLAFAAVSGRSWGRVDFMIKDRQWYCLEVNTVPGMTPTSLVPMAAKEAGIDFDDLVETILLDACL
jgi:D-alanine-D-alanine ligase